MIIDCSYLGARGLDILDLAAVSRFAATSTRDEPLLVLLCGEHDWPRELDRRCLVGLVRCHATTMARAQFRAAVGWILARVCLGTTARFGAGALLGFRHELDRDLDRSHHHGVLLSGDPASRDGHRGEDCTRRTNGGTHRVAESALVDVSTNLGAHDSQPQSTLSLALVFGVLQWNGFLRRVSMLCTVIFKQATYR